MTPMNDTSDIAHNHVVVVGRLDTTTKLHSVFHACESSTVTFAPSPPVTSKQWTVDNKYYSADVKVVVVEDSSWANDSTEITTLVNNVAPAAVVFLVNTGSEADLKVCEMWGAALDSDNVETYPETMVCLVEGQKNSVSDAAAEWCNEVGVECVRAGDCLPEDDDSVDRWDVEGIDRVVEALMCTQWPHMEMKDPATAAAGNYTGEEDDLGEEQPDADAIFNAVYMAGDGALDWNTLLSNVTFAATGSAPARPLDVDAPQVVRFKTKYYVADINLFTRRRHDMSNDNLSLPGCEGLVLCVDVTQTQSSTEALELWKGVDGFNAVAIQLCVGVLPAAHYNKATGSDHEKVKGQEDRVKAWCLENGFEYIAVPDTVLDTQQLQEKDTHGEKIGYERVIEALQCHLWTPVDMTDDAPSQSVSDATVPSTTTQTSSKSVSQATSSTSKEVVETQPKAAVKKDTVSTVSASDTKAKAKAEKKQTPLAGQDAASIDEFEKMMDYAKHVRETAHTLDDKQRREFASAAAVKLFELFGIDDSDDEGVDSD
eukprot:GFYU01003752.1.p1 GENE.GFYU01003752.1~~GFYU01003752.1.p1  ORF type:complete len:542 (+),score=176.53 GFYU01003752.1:72-1697(+)